MSLSYFPGHCYCTPGFTGEYCSLTCPPGLYGYQCQYECKCQNGALCDPIIGTVYYIIKVRILKYYA